MAIMRRQGQGGLRGGATSERTNSNEEEGLRDLEHSSIATRSSLGCAREPNLTHDALILSIRGPWKPRLFPWGSFFCAVL
eukprot:6917033-Pyramimonas_sp.AAC.1